MKTVALILPYFGKFPNYFELYLASCKANPTIDWLIYTDDETAYSYPENVYVHYCKFDDFVKKIQARYDFEICIPKPYKLCDFKPAYGEILSGDLIGYDFWGYCDCDLIFGDIRKYVTDELLIKYDKLFTRGHLSIYRNDSTVNSYYRDQKHTDFKKVFSSEQIFTFDEWGGCSRYWQQDKKPYYDEYVMDDIRVGLSDFYPTKCMAGKDSPPQLKSERLRYKKMRNIVYEYVDGKLYRCWREGKEKKTEEVLYVHLQKRPMSVCMNPCENQFLIAPNRFVSWQPMNALTLKTLAPIRIRSNDIYIESYRFAANVKWILMKAIKSVIYLLCI